MMRLLFAAIEEAISNLRIVPLRTSLALAGIMIGCGSVIATMQIGMIAERQILKDLESAGLDLIVGTPSYEMEGTFNRLPPSSTIEVEAKLRRLPSIRHAALVKEHGQEIHVRGQSTYIQIIAVTPSFIDVAKLVPASGNFSGLALRSAPIGLAGRDMLSDMANPSLRVGDFVRLGLDSYRVGALLAPTSYNGMIGLDIDRSLLVPEKSLERLIRSSSGWRIVIEAAPNAERTAIESFIKDVFLRDYEIKLDVHHADNIIAAERSQQRSLTLLLAALSSVALLVGAVGVANVMFASVAERRKEIGLRLAIGASPDDIKLLFLIEAILLCCLGGLLGTALGIISSYLYASISLADFTISYRALATAVMISMLTGLVSGYFPARQSSKLNPVEALQNES